LSPTIGYELGYVKQIPIPTDKKIKFDYVDRLINITKLDWDTYETSWDFTQLPLLSGEWEVESGKKEKPPTSHFSLSTRLSEAYTKLRRFWLEMTLETQRLEQENNRIFIEAYGLQEELTPEVPLNEITLTCNPYYRYGVEECEVGSEKWEDMESRLLQDTMKEFISYAVGCMFGRYALDKPGLILANQGETLADFVRKVGSEKWEVKSSTESTDTSHSPLSTSHLSFVPDEDNVIPMLDGDWFTDDITERFYKFLRVTFGEEHFDENLEFIERAIGKNIRKYFLKDFYTDHVKRYKKRPIYWLFSSPKGSFNALIYMHRYRPDTVSVVLNDYLREFRAKLASRKDHLEAVSISASATAGEKTRALKEIEKINKMLAELEEYERDVLYPLATEQVEIDLDDGVKVNYNKFGSALRKIPGLTVKK